MFSLVRRFQITGATQAEVIEASPADDILPNAADRWVRCITINAPSTVVYRWLCQLTVAPYSFDFIDFRGRHSPNCLIDGAEKLQIGQHFLIFSIREYEAGRFIAGISRPEFKRAYGTLSVSYVVHDVGTNATRLRANACVLGDTSAPRRVLLALGDSIMAGQQLRRIRKLAERSFAREGKDRE